MRCGSVFEARSVILFPPDRAQFCQESQSAVEEAVQGAIRGGVAGRISLSVERDARRDAGSEAIRRLPEGETPWLDLAT
jgi:hypothetical protein